MTCSLHPLAVCRFCSYTISLETVVSDCGSSVIALAIDDTGLMSGRHRSQSGRAGDDICHPMPRDTDASERTRRIHRCFASISVWKRLMIGPCDPVPPGYNRSFWTAVSRRRHRRYGEVRGSARRSPDPLQPVHGPENIRINIQQRLESTLRLVFLESCPTSVPLESVPEP